MLWRISNHANLAGIGGMVASARWHTAGRPIVYLAESPASAMLEHLIHLEMSEAERPVSYQLLKIMVEPDTAFVEVLEAELKPGWKGDEAATRALGDDWLERAETALLRVPSVLTPETSNWALNPRHADAARLRIALIHRPLYDSRLRR